jgi:hypothetical protein
MGTVLLLSQEYIVQKSTYFSNPAIWIIPLLCLGTGSLTEREGLPPEKDISFLQECQGHSCPSSNGVY